MLRFSKISDTIEVISEISAILRWPYCKYTGPHSLCIESTTFSNMHTRLRDSRLEFFFWLQAGELTRCLRGGSWRQFSHKCQFSQCNFLQIVEGPGDRSKVLPQIKMVAHSGKDTRQRAQLPRVRISITSSTVCFFQDKMIP